MSKLKEQLIIRNFPPKYPVRKKIFANFVHLIGSARIRFRKNFLNKGNYSEIKDKIKKGDIILVGQFKRVSSLFVKGPINHMFLYLGKNKLIHSVRNGVQTARLETIISEYDTVIILRSRTATPQQLNTALEYAHSRLGKPFNFEFKQDQYEKYYCSELIYQALNKADIPFNLNDPKNYGTIIKAIFRRNNTLHPMCYLNKDFRLIYHSQNLQIAKRDAEIQVHLLRIS